MKTTGTVVRHLRHLLLAADALLQRREGQRPLVAERQHLAVEHGSVGQASGGRGDLRESMGDQLLAARPQMDRPRSASPAARGCRPISTRASSPPARPASDGSSSRGDARKNGYGRDRSTSVDSSRRAAKRTTRASASIRPSAAPRRSSTGSPAACDERPHDQRLRHADAQLAGDHLQQHETLQPVERRPPRR